MLLYTQNGHFLGMGSQELSLLGYEDMHDFCLYHDDVADLFIQKSGYISKFDTFSWIDYTRHSGASNRRVLLHTKHGKCLELSLHVDEIFLNNKENDILCYFSIELTLERTVEAAISSSLDPQIVYIEKTKEETPIDPKEYSSIDQIRPDDIMSFDANLETYPEDEHEDLLQDPTLFAAPEAPFNLHASAQILGIDTLILHTLLNEYHQELLKHIDTITQGVLNNEKQYALEQIRKLKSLALQFRLYALFHPFNALQKSLEDGNQAVIQHHLSELQDAIKMFPKLIAC